MKKAIIEKLSIEASRLGWRASEFRGHINLIKKIAKNGNELKNIVDVGAHRGAWATAIKTVLPRSNYFLVDPNSRFSNELTKLGVYIPAVLSDEIKKVNFFQTGGTGDSYFRENSVNYNKVIPSQLETRRADQIEELPRSLDVIKVDTQGSELDVLAGFGRKLEAAKLIILEVPLYTYNLGAPSFEEYVEFMTGLGFFATRIVGTNLVAGKLVQIDLAFVPESILPAM